MRKLVYAYAFGILSTAILTLHLTPPPEEISFQEKVDTLALILEGDKIVNPHKVASVPIPKRKPEQGYTMAHIEDFNRFIEGFVE